MWGTESMMTDDLGASCVTVAAGPEPATSSGLISAFLSFLNQRKSVRFPLAGLEASPIELAILPPDTISDDPTPVEVLLVVD